MGFVRRTATTGKVEIPEEARKKTELTFLHKIVYKVKEFKIPLSLILNLDQTKYGSNHFKVCVYGQNTSGERRFHILTFIIAINETFLPMQLIYGEKTVQILTKFDFSESLSLSEDFKYYSNTAKSIKLIKEIIVPLKKNIHV